MSRGFLRRKILIVKLLLIGDTAYITDLITNKEELSQKSFLIIFLGYFKLSCSFWSYLY